MSSTEIAAKAKEYRELQQFIKQLQEEADALKADMLAELEARGADTLEAGLFTITCSTYRSNRVDTAALKMALPDVAAQFTKTTEACRFQVA